MSILKILLRLCIFQAKPQDVPASYGLLLLVVIANTITNLLADNLHPEFTTKLAASIAQVIVFGATIHLALTIGRRPERWLQTVTALYGASAITQLIAWPIASWVDRVKDVPQDVAMPLSLMMLIMIWYLAVMTSIMKSTFERSTPMALLITLACVIVSGLVVLAIFGDLSKVTA